MNQPIFILEGADGTGKTTLANTIAEKKKASILHCFYDKSWNIKDHHTDMWNSAVMISKWCPVVLDRWSVSEYVYGNAFREKPGYDIMDFIWEKTEGHNVHWIYCENDKTIENHKKNIKIRNEMFDDMTDVVYWYDVFIKDKSFSIIPWNIYNFNKVDMYKFVKDLDGKNY